MDQKLAMQLKSAFLEMKTHAQEATDRAEKLLGEIDLLKAPMPCAHPAACLVDRGGARRCVACDREEILKRQVERLEADCSDMAASKKTSFERCPCGRLRELREACRACGKSAT